MISTDTLASLKLMASDPKKRALLLKDSTCIGGLVIVLSNSDSSIVQDSLETLQLLCDSKEGPSVLTECMGLDDQLNHLMHGKASCSVVKNLAENLYSKLHQQKETAIPLKDVSNMSRKSNGGSRNSSLSCVQPKTKSVVLQIRGLYDKADRDLCARLLLKCKGVISITFDLNKKRCILRTKLDVSPEALATSIAKSMTMVAQQVVKNEKGEESFINFNSIEGLCDSNVDKENSELPDYLSDESDTGFIEDRALKRPSKEDCKTSNNWFSTAANFLSNSFYW